MLKVSKIALRSRRCVSSTCAVACPILAKALAISSDEKSIVSHSVCFDWARRQRRLHHRWPPSAMARFRLHVNRQRWSNCRCSLGARRWRRRRRHWKYCSWAHLEEALHRNRKRHSQFLFCLHLKFPFDEQIMPFSVWQWEEWCKDNTWFSKWNST